MSGQKVVALFGTFGETCPFFESPTPDQIWVLLA
jgi:hypothetical protein